METIDISFGSGWLGFKYIGKQHAEHLITCIQKYYPVSVDWNGVIYCGVSLNWELKKNMSPCLCQDMWMVTCMNINTKIQQYPSMHKKMRKTILWGQNSVGSKWEQHTYTTIWRQKIYTKGGRKISLLCKSSWPHHAGSVRNISRGTTTRDRRQQKAVAHLLDFCATNPDSKLRFHSSEMKLGIHSDASYLS